MTEPDDASGDRDPLGLPGWSEPGIPPRPPVRPPKARILTFGASAFVIALFGLISNPYLLPSLLAIGLAARALVIARNVPVGQRGLGLGLAYAAIVVGVFALIGSSIALVGGVG